MKYYLNLTTGKKHKETERVGIWNDGSPMTAKEAANRHPFEWQEIPTANPDEKQAIFDLACKFALIYAEIGTRVDPEHCIKLAKDMYNEKERI